MAKQNFELPSQTWQRITGKSWMKPDQMAPFLKEAGISDAPGSSQANVLLQQKLTGGWKPSFMQTPSSGATVIQEPPKTPSIATPPGSLLPGESGQKSNEAAKPPTIDYSGQVKDVYLKNFGRNPTESELGQQQESLGKGWLTTDQLLKWATEHPENVSKNKIVSAPQPFQGEPLAMNEEERKIAENVLKPEIKPAVETVQEPPKPTLPETGVTTDSLNKYIAQMINQPVDYGAESKKALEGYRQTFGAPETRIAARSQETQNLYEEAKKKAVADLKGDISTRGLLSSGYAEKAVADTEKDYTKELGADLEKIKTGDSETEQKAVWDWLKNIVSGKEQEKQILTNLMPEILKLGKPTVKTDFIGNSESGYYSVSYDPSTGKEISRVQVIPPVAKKESYGDKYGSGDMGLYNLYAEQEKAAGRTPKPLNDWLTEDANRKAKITAAANAQGLDWKTTNFISGISTSFDNAPITKQFNDVQNKYLSIQNIIDSGVGGPGDVALVFDFMKALDPTSVVRESEYATAAKSGNIFKGWAAKFNGYFKDEGGFLPENVKKSFKEVMGVKLGAIRSQYQNLKNEKARLIEKNTGAKDAESFLINYDYNIARKPAENATVTTPKGQLDLSKFEGK